jgi:hypothetical protein
VTVTHDAASARREAAATGTDKEDLKLLT